MPEPVVQVEGLWKKYDIHPLHSVWAKGARLWRRLRGREAEEADFWALRGVDFQVGRGEALGVVGPNGAGKSTLLKVLCGVTAPTLGSVRVSGRVAPLIELGAGFHPELTGRENVVINAVVLGMSLREAKRKYARIVEFAGLEEFMDTPIKKYSSGMYVRLAFSVAVHTDPEILLVDEVLAVGDHIFRSKSLDLMRDFRKKGVPIVFVSHNMHEISKACEKGLFLEGGEVRFHGPIDDAIHAYLWPSGKEDATGGVRPLMENEMGIAISDFSFYDEAGQRTSAVRFGEPCVARFTIATRIPISGVVLSLVLIRTEDNLRVSISRTSHESVSVSLDGPTEIEATMQDIRCINGTYEMDITVSDSAMGCLMKYRTYPFRVVGAPPQESGPNASVLLGAAKWRVRSLSRNEGGGGSSADSRAHKRFSPPDSLDTT